ncbi:hypothetical protein KJ365_02685 [Glaciecola sp. XM2]|jgi:hypothetical protein|uniref:hypothetical protein n=1 Tax=Glaciecola sp. XM2 TaxID=1914931 RepID=UPI001BDEF001|nr:hypothetical protein [Glaciecola sp. XM2]MBT1449772.1 hypothetical protein [Glaciecola sp. XM2]
MAINATLVGQLLFGLAIIMAMVGFFLGRKKTNHPIAATILGFMSGFFPPFAFIFVLVLILRKNIEKPA